MPVRIVLDVPITFDVAGETTHAPMVEARIGETTTKLILDTGSSDHVLTIELAEAATLPAVPGEAGVDHAGGSVPSWRLGEVPARIGDLEVVLRDAVAIVGPPPFLAWGVGGFLSPQHLVPDAFVAIDLAADRFVVATGEDGDVDGWIDERWPGLGRLTLARDPVDPTPVVQASIEPFGSVRVMLNTGGRSTEFTTAAVEGLRGTAPERLGKGVGGRDVEATEVVGRTLRVGDVRLDVPALLVRESIGPIDGMVGMDVLRGTVLLVRADRTRPVTWLLPPPDGPHRERPGAA